MSRSGSSGTTPLIQSEFDTKGFERVIACAGLQSDRLVSKSGEDKYPTGVPLFGQYFILESRLNDVVSGVIYPMPAPQRPFLGVHMIRCVDGGLQIGPNGFLSLSREGCKGLDLNLLDSVSVGSDPRFWKFAAGNMSTAPREIGGVLSTGCFVAEAARDIPAPDGADGPRAARGIRAQVMNRNGT